MINTRNAIGKMLQRGPKLKMDKYSNNKTEIPKTDNEALSHLTPSGQILYKKMRKAKHTINYAFDAALAGIDLTKEIN